MPEPYDWKNAGNPNEEAKITSIFDFSSEALGQLKLWFEQQGINVPVSQIPGFSQFGARLATVLSTAGETTTSNTYVDLATAGPEITELSNGKYMLVYGAQAHNTTATGGGIISVSVNGGAASDDNLAATYPDASAAWPTGSSSIVRATLADLVDGNNTVTMKYRRGNATGTAGFANRWLVAIRYANP